MTDRQKCNAVVAYRRQFEEIANNNGSGVSYLLRCFGLEYYGTLFEEQEIDIGDVEYLTYRDLYDMNVSEEDAWSILEAGQYHGSMMAYQFPATHHDYNDKNYGLAAG